MRRIKRNPHQLALDLAPAKELRAVAEHISTKWQSAMFNEPGRHLVPMSAIALRERMRGLRVVAAVYVMNDPDTEIDGGVDMDGAVKGDGQLVIPMFINMAKRPDERGIYYLLYHELLHLVFAARARCGGLVAVSRAELNTREQWEKCIKSEGEFMSRALTVVRALEDRLEKIWRGDKREARRKVQAWLGWLPNDLVILMERERDAFMLGHELAMALYAMEEPYAKRLSQIIKYSLEDKIAQLEAQRR